ncbi:DUF3077 domain-containing protein [Pseudomonas sp. FP453]|uniref:DUF6124 family protein n=1 Tax=Pseudomonas sp. FP453 TaxID=2954094 RepID=UPI0027373619|nr:DUF3077 domain-containing protein [Pseudomonas sp. FP453]WLH88374.1 DUF3077 domain-containing protein [Pseudomonas sp. FP453]
MTTSLHPQPELAETADILDMRSSGAVQRALDYYLKEEVSLSATDDTFFSIKPGISQEEALVHASDLLRSAAATAYESASSHQGNNRDLAFSVVYLIDMAKAMVERSLRAPETQATV